MKNNIKSRQDLVRDFMVQTDQIDPSGPKVDINNLTEKDLAIIRLRLKLLTEELGELFETFLDKNTFQQDFLPLFNIIESKTNNLKNQNLDLDIVKIAHAVSDLDYVLTGIPAWLSIPQDACFQAIHESNMTKLDPITGKVFKRTDGKVVKPDNFIPVDLTNIVKNI